MLSTYHAPATDLGFGDITVNKTMSLFHSVYILVGMQTISKQTNEYNILLCNWKFIVGYVLQSWYVNCQHAPTHLALICDPWYQLHIRVGSNMDAKLPDIYPFSEKR